MVYSESMCWQMAGLLGAAPVESTQLAGGLVPRGVVVGKVTLFIFVYDCCDSREDTPFFTIYLPCYV